MTSPTQLTLRELRGQGYIATAVEKYNAYSGTRHDLFGFADVLAVGNGETVAVQATTYSNVSARVRKIANNEKEVPECREAGWRILVWGWHQPRGPRTRWKYREVDVS